ncbi:NAD-P-binding protein [Earliella scabrosa]|nr:NAD-P-binding protein [Earliella scabrosa]
MSTITWLITGTSRGIGLALTARLLQDPSNIVVAACRNPDKAATLNELKRTAKGKLYVVKIDVTDEASIRNSYDEVASIVGDKGIDILYNNAGILLANDKPFSMSTELLMQQFLTNVAGPALVSQTFLPLVEKSVRKMVVNVTSLLASIGSKLDVRYSPYSITKTALNMLTYKQVVERPDLTIIALDPGWAKTACVISHVPGRITKLGGPDAPVEVEDSVTGIINILGGVKHEDSGAFIMYNGTRLPW